MKRIKIGDSFAVGPAFARLTNGSVIDLTDAHIEAQVKAGGLGAAVLTKKSANMSGGSASQVEVTDLATGEIYVYFTTSDTAALIDGTTYHMDIRVRTAAGSVYTVASAEFQMEAAHTEVPAA